MGLVSPKVHVGMSRHSAGYSVNFGLCMYPAEIDISSATIYTYLLPRHHLLDSKQLKYGRDEANNNVILTINAICQIDDDKPALCQTRAIYACLGLPLRQH